MSLFLENTSIYVKVGTQSSVLIKQGVWKVSFKRSSTIYTVILLFAFTTARWGHWDKRRIEFKASYKTLDGYLEVRPVLRIMSVHSYTTELNKNCSYRTQCCIVAKFLTASCMMMTTSHVLKYNSRSSAEHCTENHSQGQNHHRQRSN